MNRNRNAMLAGGGRGGSGYLLLLSLISFLSLAPLFAEDITVFVIKGPSGVGLIKLFEQPPVIAGGKVKAELVTQADIMASRFTAGEVKIGILPINTAAKLASALAGEGKTKLQIAAITGEGMLKLLTIDGDVKGINDIAKKTVYCSGQGAVPEFVFRQILASKKIDNTRLNFSLAYPEAALSLAAGKIQNALLPEPFASLALSKNDKIKTVDNIQKLWSSINGGKVKNYPITALVVDSDFAAARKDAMDAILKAVEVSINWVVKNPKEAGILVEKHNFGLKAAVIENAIPQSAYSYTSAQKARPAVEALLKSFLEFSPASVGGRLPDDSFYYGGAK